MLHHKSSYICAVSFGLAIGLTWGLGMLIMGLLATWYSYGNAFITLTGSIYPGYMATVGGSFVGFFWGLIDGFITGTVIALFYNLFTNCCGCCGRCCKCGCKPGSCKCGDMCKCHVCKKPEPKIDIAA